MKIGICGATGYSGRELIRLLLKHPKAEIVFASSEQFSGRAIADVFPEFRSRIDLVCQNLEFAPNVKNIDLVFLALPHTVSMKMAKLFLQKGIKVIDLSGDYRLSGEEYEKWYNYPHEDPNNLPRAIYGLTEFFRDKIKGQDFISNPGCYPTATCLGLGPALSMGWIKSEGIMIDAKSGVTGAGRSPSLGNLFCEANENMKPYKIGVHQHTPEIEKVLKYCAKKDVQVTFVPHLVPLDKGILSTIYGGLDSKGKRRITSAELLEGYRNFYKNEPFIRILPEGVYPQTHHVQGTNYCDIGLHVDERTDTLVIVSAIDNMVKGAAGQAIQNMNVMMGFREEEGLLC